MESKQNPLAALLAGCDGLTVCSCADWPARFGEEPPTTLDGWRALAVRCGVDPNELLNGSLTLHELAVFAEGYFSRLNDAKPAEATVAKSTNALEPEAPAPLLLSWREITDALGRPNNAEFRECLRRLNDQHDGPLVVPGRGAQPKVHREKLVAWWNSLESRLTELDARKRDQEATVENRYLYGSGGEVVPDISGGVKRRRGGST